MKCRIGAMALVAGLSAIGARADAIGEGWPARAWACVMERFYSPKTSLLYDFRTGEGDEGLCGKLPTPEEIRACQPCATGWCAGMEDSVLNGCPMLLAAICRWEATGDAEARRDGLKIFRGLVRCAEVSGIEGFLARSVSPADGRSFFPNSSRDQYTLFVYAMWRFSRSEMAGGADAPERVKARRLIVAVARFCEKSVCPENDYRLLRADGKPAYVSQMWTATPGVCSNPGGWASYYGGIASHEVARLPMFYAAAFSVTGLPHWREMELRYADRAIAMANGSWGEEGRGFAVFQAQVSHRLLYETETDPARKAKYRALLRRWAGFAVHAVGKYRASLAAVGGNVYRYADDWRVLKRRPLGHYGETRCIWRADYEAAFEAQREAAEAPLIALLAPGVPVPASCRLVLEELYGSLDYSRVTSVAGLVHALMAYWLDVAEDRALNGLIPQPQKVRRGRGFVPAAACASPVVDTAPVAGAPRRVADEAYVLDIAKDGVRITAGGAAGERNARVTLKQLVDLSGGSVPCCTITDWPLLKYRGFMLDTGRNYLDVASLRYLFDVMAAYKMNLFHWHLTEYYGWRLESAKYPQIAEKGWWDPKGTRHRGKYYTRAEFRELVDYAHRRGIVVMPEFDVPGHALAFRTAFGLERMSDPRATRLLRDLFDELCKLVPLEQMPFVHMGGDEVGLAWEKSTPEALRSISQVIADNGRTTVFWDPGEKFEAAGDRIHMVWGTRREGLPEEAGRMLDARPAYIENFELFELPGVASYRRPFFEAAELDERHLGAEICGWHDLAAGLPYKRLLSQQHAIPAVVMFADNFWHGRRFERAFRRHRLPSPDDVRLRVVENLERRLALHRDTFFADGEHAFHFLRQTQMRWRLSETNGTVVATDIPQASVLVCLEPNRPENLYHSPTGTVVAETWIRSPDDRTVGAWIGFTGFDFDNGRQRTGTPEQGEWNVFGAYIELNGERVPPPRWEQPGLRPGKFYSDVRCDINELDEIPFGNDEYFQRPPTPVRLRRGWNHVKLHLPMPKPVKGTWSHRWVGTFVPVAGTSDHPHEVDDLFYSAQPPEGTGR